MKEADVLFKAVQECSSEPNFRQLIAAKKDSH